MMVDLSTYPLESLKVSKTIRDAFWQLESHLVDVSIPDNYSYVLVKLEDHSGANKTVFYGITAPDESYKLKLVEEAVDIYAYDLRWYLSRQFVPESQLVLANTDDIITYIEDLLGGSDWATVTGVEPYRVRNPDPIITKKEFIFNPSTSKLDAITEIAEYYNCIFEVKWRNVGTEQSPEWVTSAYFVRSNEIDDEVDGLDLPSPTILAKTDNDTIEITVANSSDDKYNRIIAIGCDSSGNWYKGVVESPNVTDGTARPREYMEYLSPYVVSQETADQRASELYALFNFPVKRISAKLTQRHDLQLYQLVKFDGWTEYTDALYTVGMAGINWVRIVEISHVKSATISEVNIVCVPDRDLSQSRLKAYSVTPNTVDDTESIIMDTLASLASAEIGTAADPLLGSSITTVALNRGGTITAKLLGANESIVLPVNNERVIVSGGGGGGFKNPAEEDLDMNGFKVKTSETGKDLVFEVPVGQKIVFTRSTA
ncbi:hypothetical protein [Methanolobus halotolerans]|uniref:Uncharacterized protein n=1 Tax=Methanolobus halotolerans TaxID=2052935 RepID=A0A4E0QQP5_9EURY|nr:hypothetical protein [Methanolobus halotolerans]TGC08133.1 hypothetical protein CUN85_09935 [Methanolobus halotolerans]